MLLRSFSRRAEDPFDLCRASRRYGASRLDPSAPRALPIEEDRAPRFAAAHSCASPVHDFCNSNAYRYEFPGSARFQLLNKHLHRRDSVNGKDSQKVSLAQKHMLPGAFCIYSCQGATETTCDQWPNVTDSSLMPLRYHRRSLRRFLSGKTVCYGTGDESAPWLKGTSTLFIF